MKLLFDHNVPKKLRGLLPGHEIHTAYQQGWAVLRDSELLQAAEVAGFDAMLTGDKNLSFQQNLRAHKLALVVLADTDWPTLKANPAPVVAALREVKPGRVIRLLEPISRRNLK